ncbi:unnamed protein product [Paramecium pentaurelia]|uniref:Uncharacterized protein n=1 Tax=Paramecium pentaurelia TaxID=43138 RepID=A0A8S1VTF5_9CILI|nr:unnamed protein product [Paramecium pentaurelia]
MNIILDRQASLCYFPNSSDVDHIDKAHQFDQKDFTKDLCNLTNFGYFIPKTDYTSTLVTEYFVQLKSYNYADQNFTECLKSTVTNESIQIFELYIEENSYKTLIDTNISIQDQQLQVAYILKDHNLIIGVSDDYTIQLHIQSSYDKSLYFSSEFRFEQQFQQFLITFNNLITLIINPEFKS